MISSIDRIDDIAYKGTSERSKQMTQALANFAKVSGLSNQQAYTLAVIVRYNMKRGQTMEEAVASYMDSMKDMLAGGQE